MTGGFFVRGRVCRRSTHPKGKRGSCGANPLLPQGSDRIDPACPGREDFFRAPLEEYVSNEQRDEQLAPAAPQEDPRRELAKKGALAVMGGVVSGVVRFCTEAVLGSLFRDGS